MLNIVDLHQEQELSVSSMSKVTGGANALTEIGGAIAQGIGDTLKGLGLQGAADVAYTVAAGIYCFPAPVR